MPRIHLMAVAVICSVSDLSQAVAQIPTNPSPEMRLLIEEARRGCRETQRSLEVAEAEQQTISQDLRRLNEQVVAFGIQGGEHYRLQREQLLQTDETNRQRRSMMTRIITRCRSLGVLNE